MNFLGMGPGELILIIIIALIVLGPGKFPEIARTLGKMARELRSITDNFQDELRKEIDLDELSAQKPKTEAQKPPQLARPAATETPPLAEKPAEPVLPEYYRDENTAEAEGHREGEPAKAGETGAQPADEDARPGSEIDVSNQAALNTSPPAEAAEVGQSEAGPLTDTEAETVVEAESEAGHPDRVQ